MNHDSGRGPGPATPRWVKIFGAVMLSAILLVAALKFFGGGQHGPGRHFRSQDSGRPAADSGHR